MKQSTKEQLKIISIATIACVIIAGMSYAIIKITVSVTTPLVWTVGEMGISQTIAVVGIIIAIAGIGIISIVVVGGMFVLNSIMPEEEFD